MPLRVKRSVLRVKPFVLRVKRSRVKRSFISVVCSLWSKDHLCNVLRVKHLSLRVKQMTLRVKQMTLRVKQVTLRVKQYIKI